MSRILIYAPMIGRGGVHRVVQRLMQGFAACANPDEFQFAVLGQALDENHHVIEWPASWRFEQIAPSSYFPYHPQLFQWLHANAETFVAHLKRKLADEHFDLVYCPSPWWTVRVKDFTLPVPFVTSVADFAFDHIDMGVISLFFKAAAVRVAQHADMSIFASDFQRRWGEAHYGFTRCETIPYSADFVADNFARQATPAEASRVSAKYGLPPDYFLAFHPMYHKGIKTVLRALACLSDSHRPLVIAGIDTDKLLADEPENPQIAEVQAIIQQLCLEYGEDYVVLGRVPDEDMGGLYAGAVCAIAASESEGDLSCTMFEALTARTPLVYSDLPVFTERIGFNQYGLSFPVNDHEALARCLMQVVQNPTAAAERSANGLWWTQWRSVANVCEDYLNVFRFQLGYVKGGIE